MKIQSSITYLGLCSLLVLASCKKDTENPNSAQHAVPGLTDTVTRMGQDSVITQTQEMKQAPGLQWITEPVNINGCSCYFSKTEEDLKAMNYLYQDDYGNKAYIQYSGKIIDFPMQEESFDPQNLTKNLKSKGYRLKLEGKLKKNGNDPELYRYDGWLEVTAPDGKVTKDKVVGECGC